MLFLRETCISISHYHLTIIVYLTTNHITSHHYQQDSFNYLSMIVNQILLDWVQLSSVGIRIRLNAMDLYLLIWTLKDSIEPILTVNLYLETYSVICECRYEFQSYWFIVSTIMNLLAENVQFKGNTIDWVE